MGRVIFNSDGVVLNTDTSRIYHEEYIVNDYTMFWYKLQDATDSGPSGVTLDISNVDFSSGSAYFNTAGSLSKTSGDLSIFKLPQNFSLSFWLKYDSSKGSHGTETIYNIVGPITGALRFNTSTVGIFESGTRNVRDLNYDWAANKGEWEFHCVTCTGGTLYMYSGLSADSLYLSDDNNGVFNGIPSVDNFAIGALVSTGPIFANHLIKCSLSNMLAERRYWDLDMVKAVARL